MNSTDESLLIVFPKFLIPNEHLNADALLKYVYKYVLLLYIKMRRIAAITKTLYSLCTPLLLDRPNDWLVLIGQPFLYKPVFTKFQSLSFAKQQREGYALFPCMLNESVYQCHHRVVYGN